MIEPSWGLVIFAYIAGIATVCLVPFAWVWLDRRYIDTKLPPSR